MTELDWLASLVAEVSAHLGEPTVVEAHDAPAASTWRWAWPGNRTGRFLVVLRSKPFWYEEIAWKVRVGMDGRTVDAAWPAQQPRVDDVRRLLEVAGLLPPPAALTSVQVADSRELHAVLRPRVDEPAESAIGCSSPGWPSHLDPYGP